MLNMPIELSMIVQDYARPVTRVDWKNGAKHAEAFKNSEEFKDFEYYGYSWATYSDGETECPRFDATFAYEWANETWSNKIKKQVLQNGGEINDFTVDNHTRMCLLTGNIKWFWFNEPYHNYLDYDFNKKFWNQDF